MGSRLASRRWRVAAFAASGCASASAATRLHRRRPAPAPFSGERAFAHLEALVALGPRVAGTPAAGPARAYLRASWKALGLSVHEDEFRFASEPGAPEQVLANLWAEIPGTHPGLFVVATPLDTPPGESPGANEGGSGAALLLELARALHERPLPYSVRLLFLDGELLTDETAFLGSAHAHRSLAESGELQTLRLLLYVHQVGDRELEIRRDRARTACFASVFFAAARGAGLAAAFPSAAPYRRRAPRPPRLSSRAASPASWRSRTSATGVRTSPANTGGRRRTISRTVRPRASRRWERSC